MARVIFENLTLEQAIAFAHWYGCSGENSADVWFDINEMETPIADTTETEGDTTTVYCK